MRFSLIGTGFIMPRHAEAIEALGGKLVDTVNTAYDTSSQAICATCDGRVALAP